MINKKAYIRTAEAIIAAVITMLFVIYVIPQYTAIDEDRDDIEILSKVYDNPSFRKYVVTQNRDKIHEQIKEVIPARFDYVIQISKTGRSPSDLPLKKINIDGIIISGSDEVYDPIIVKVYYWLK